MKSFFTRAATGGIKTPLAPDGPGLALPVAPVRAGAPTATVIGSGFGGLAAAVRLSCRGYAVTVLEKLDAPGGRAYVYRQDGFTFDAGPTIITAPFMLEELWAMCGRRLSDDVELRRSIRSTASASSTAPISTTAATR